MTPATARGPIKIWYSNNAQEVAWGKQAVAAWNSSHANEQVSAEEVPAGKSSEEVITAAITAGTEPCLIYNTSPAAVPGFQKQGGLVDLSSFSDGTSYIEARTDPAIAKQYQSSDGHYYQGRAVEGQSGDDLLQQEDLRQGRHRYRQAAVGHVRQFPGHQPEDRLVEGREVRHIPHPPAASSTSPGSTSTRCLRPTAAENSW